MCKAVAQPILKVRIRRLLVVKGSSEIQNKIFLTLQFKLDSMSFSKLNKLESGSRKSTEQDSGSDKDEEFLCTKTNPQKHKTELCKTFSELGYCPYQSKCRFAHGKHELVGSAAKRLSKNRKCNGFWKNGCCPYGSRCQFGHAQTTWEEGAILLGLEAICRNDPPQLSKLLHKIL